MVAVNEPKIKMDQVCVASDGNNDEDDDEEEEKSSEMPPAPDGGWGWMVTFASFVIHMITDGLTYSFGLFYEQFIQEFKEGKGATAWICSILVGVTLCSGPISSAFVNRYGCRTVTIVGAILAAISFAISIYATNIAFLYCSIGFGAGFGLGLIYLPAIVCVTMYFEKYRSLATGIAVCGSGFGTFVFAPLLEYFINSYGWRISLLITAVIAAKCVLFGAMFRPLKPAKPKIILENTAVQPEEKNGKFFRLKDNEESGIKVTVMGTENSIRRPHSIAQIYIPVKQDANTKAYQSSDYLNSNNDQNEIYRMAISHPMLMTEHSKQMYNYRKTGPLYRQDIFYQGSLMNLAQYKSKNEKKLNDTTTKKLVKKSKRLKSKKRRTTICGCIECSQQTKDTLSEMLDFSLLQNPVFILFTISNFCTSVGFNVPFVYMVSRANQLESIRNGPFKASVLLSVIGIANTFGRIVLGYISDKPQVNRLIVYNTCLTICGITTILSAFCYDFISYCIYCSIFGFTIGAYVGLTSVILVDLLGLEKLTNAFGLLLLFQGIASFLGPPIAGWLYDICQSYNPGFYMAGFSIFMSGLILFLIPTIQRWQKRRATEKFIVKA